MSHCQVTKVNNDTSYSSNLVKACWGLTFPFVFDLAGFCMSLHLDETRKLTLQHLALSRSVLEMGRNVGLGLETCMATNVTQEFGVFFFYGNQCQEFSFVFFLSDFSPICFHPGLQKDIYCVFSGDRIKCNVRSHTCSS